MEHAVALMVAFLSFTTGLSIFMRQSYWLKWIKNLKQEGDNFAIWVGYILIFMGSFIVAFHWKWDVIGIAVTLLGMSALIKGIVYMLFPEKMKKLVILYVPRSKKLLPVSGTIMLLIGLIAFMEWYKG